MNEFQIIDSDGRTHWIRSCNMCRCLYEVDQEKAHLDQCARVYMISSPLVSGIPM